MDKKVKILIADDSAFMRKVLKDILGTAGFENFIECGNGRECIEKYESEKPKVILLDLIMPEIDGMGVLKKIGGKAKILIISAVGQEKTLEEAKNLGASGYLVKPFDNRQVIKEIEKLF